MGRPKTTDEQFWARVDRSGGPEACWPWRGSLTSGGYGSTTAGLTRNGKSVTVGAHRRALAIHLGRPLTPGLMVLHSCDNRPCCNPAHLREGTVQENHADARARGRHARGDATGSRKYPERRPRGAAVTTAKLTPESVSEILARLAAGETQAALARAFGVGLSQMSRIARGQSWAHLARRAG